MAASPGTLYRPSVSRYSGFDSSFSTVFQTKGGILMVLPTAVRTSSSCCEPRGQPNTAAFCDTPL